MRSGPVCLGHRVTHFTLCPLGQPEIAIGHEPRIEPWLTQSTTLACRSLNSMELPQVAEKLMRIKRQNPCSEADGKWAGSRETNLDSSRGRTFFLDIPFYRTH